MGENAMADSLMRTPRCSGRRAPGVARLVSIPLSELESGQQRVEGCRGLVD